VLRLAATHHPLRYAAEFGRYESIATMIAKRQVDIGILKEPVTHPGISVVPLAECGTVCVMPAQHPLARQAEVAVAARVREPWWPLRQACSAPAWWMSSRRPPRPSSLADHQRD
jgi:DNA-binding transcriptional LysR family regulator